MSKRYQIREGSQSGHCCFEATVVDTHKPDMYNGEHFFYNGEYQYTSVCEAFDMEDAELICNALNAMEE